MYAAKLRKVGGSVMVALPTPLLKILRLRAGEQMGLSLEGDKLLLLTPQRPPHYTMAELLAATDYSGQRAEEGQEWPETPPQGREIL